MAEAFKDFPPSSLLLIETLLAVDPAERRNATAALRNELFTTKPYACEPSSLPKYPPSKEMDAKIWDVEATRLRAAGRDNADRVRKSRACDCKGIPAPEANAERQANVDRQRLITHANVKSKSEKFPPPHHDGTLGYPLGSSDHIDPAFDPLDVSYSSTSFSYSEESVQTWSGQLVKPAAVRAPRRKQHSSGQIHSLSEPLRKDSKAMRVQLGSVSKKMAFRTTFCHLVGQFKRLQLLPIRPSQEGTMLSSFKVGMPNKATTMCQGFAKPN